MRCLERAVLMFEEDAAVPAGLKPLMLETVLSRPIERKAPISPGFFRRFAEFAFSPWYVLIKNVIFSKNVVEFVKVIDYNNTIL